MTDAELPDREVVVSSDRFRPNAVTVRVGMTEITLTQTEAREVADRISARLGITEYRCHDRGHSGCERVGKMTIHHPAVSALESVEG